MMTSKPLLIALILSLSLALFPAHAVVRYTPSQGDHFSYHEVANLGSGTGDYAGYTEHTVVDGTERMTGVFGNGTVSANYNYTWTWNNSTGGTETGNSFGNFTFSSTSFLYVKGTDNQTGYVNPTVWFYIDNSTLKDGTFYLLNTQMTVTSTSYSYYLPSQNRNVNTILAEGSSYYQRDDVYGQFNAAYTWKAYFDPATGYTIGYDYSEQDTSPSGTGFTYTESLYVTSTSYPLTTAAASFDLSQYVGYIAIAIALVIIIIVGVVIYAVSKSRRTLPRHPLPSERPPPTIDLTPKQQPPVQQIVIKEVVKVKCLYCGALIDSTVKFCPFCGAPRT